MKQRTKDLATEWLKTAKSKDTFTIETVPHSKHEVEALLGFPASIKEQSHKHKDIKDKEHGDMGKKHHEGHSKESGDGISKGSE
jgi:hypothetical protein